MIYPTNNCYPGSMPTLTWTNGSKAGPRMFTWESHAAPHESFQQAEEARRKYGGMAVRPAHSRGVAGVMPGGACGSLEGAGSITQRDEEAFIAPYTNIHLRLKVITVPKLVVKMGKMSGM